MSYSAICFRIAKGRAYGAPNQSIFPTFSYGLFDFLYAQLDFLCAQLDFLCGQLVTFYMLNKTLSIVN